MIKEAVATMTLCEALDGHEVLLLKRATDLYIWETGFLSKGVMTLAKAPTKP